MKAVSENPPIRTHLGTKQAYVNLGGKRKYLGRADAPEVQEKYKRAVAEWKAGQRHGRADTDKLLVAELLAAFIEHAETYYRGPDGKATSSLGNYKTVAKAVRLAYGGTHVRDFGPNCLRAVRQGFVDNGWSREVCNRYVSLIRTIVRWGVGEEMVHPETLTRLEALSPLKRGRSKAFDYDDVGPVEDEIIDATIPHLSRVVGEMVRLQRMTGMRPGEVCAMRTGDINMRGPIWFFRPPAHKTSYRGKKREVYIGPKGQEVLQPFLCTDLAAFIFSPAESEAEHRERRHDQRTTPDSCGNTIGTNRRRKPKRKPGDKYRTDAYGKAVERACAKAFPIPDGLDDDQAAAWRRDHWWRPNRLRHTFATVVREDYGVEASQVLLGHEKADTTQIYAERNRKLGIAVALKIG